MDGKMERKFFTLERGTMAGGYDGKGDWSIKSGLKSVGVGMSHDPKKQGASPERS